ncbi:MAG: hypothetical protein Q8M18_07310 [Bradyrhizobium sp.]|nr:hypothetical protein [Bradyrhizobium sp.]
MALAALPASVGLAQTAPSTGAAPAATAPAATAPAATTPPTASKEATTTTSAKPAKKKAAKKMTRQQEIDRSIDSGTVPARYRSSVPKQYHHLIPFDKR